MSKLFALFFDSIECMCVTDVSSDRYEEEKHVPNSIILLFLCVCVRVSHIHNNIFD